MAATSAAGAARSAVKTYVQDLRHLPSRLQRRAFKTETYEEMLLSAQIASKNEMKRTLKWPTLTLLCIGHMIGGGIFILTGTAARTQAGPAVILSYLIGGAVAVVTASNYAEMGSDYPLAGASFNYVLAVWGEFPAWITIVAIAIDALLGAGALARGWSSYLAVLCDQPSDRFLVRTGSHDLDFVAFGLIIAIFLLIAWGTHQTSLLNSMVKVTNLVIIILVLAFTFPHADRHNWDEFFPFGAHGVFQGSALIFFAYGGYNAASNLAEEAVNPRKDIPFAIMLSMGTVTTLYVLMCMAITLAVPYAQIDKSAPFSVLFKTIDHWHWASYLVSVGAVLGVGTVVLVGKMCTVRDLLVMSRHGLIPGALAHINKYTGTPLRMILIYGVCCAVVALTTSFETLAKLTNVGSLFVVCMVAGVVSWRRYYEPGSVHTSPLAFWLLLARFVLIVTLSIVFTVAWNLDLKYGYYVGFGIPIVLLGLSFFFISQKFQPQHFKTPIVPVSCTFCIFAGIFLIGSAGYEACYRFGIVLGVCLVTYIFYGVHASERHADRVHAHAERTKGIEHELEEGKPYADGKVFAATKISLTPAANGNGVSDAKLSSNII